MIKTRMQLTGKKIEVGMRTVMMMVGEEEATMLLLLLLTTMKMVEIEVEKVSVVAAALPSRTQRPVLPPLAANERGWICRSWWCLS